MTPRPDRYALLKGLHFDEQQENPPVTTNASDTNRIELVGTVADVQHKTTASGKSFIVVNVEVRRTWVDRDGHKQERLETIPVTSWRRGSGLAVGTRVQVEGRLSSRSYMGRTDGVTRLAIDVTAEIIEPLDDPGANPPGDASSDPKANPAAAPLDDSDIPF